MRRSRNRTCAGRGNDEKFSAGLLPIILAVLSLARFGRPALKRLSLMAVGIGESLWVSRF